MEPLAFSMLIPSSCVATLLQCQIPSKYCNLDTSVGVSDLFYNLTYWSGPLLALMHLPFSQSAGYY